MEGKSYSNSYLVLASAYAGITREAEALEVLEKAIGRRDIFTDEEFTQKDYDNFKMKLQEIEKFE
jgi:hypothetical protein